MLRLRKTLLLLWVIFLLLLSSCSQQPPSAETDGGYTFTDSLGESVTLNTKPTNVAVLFSSFADIWTLSGGEVSITVGEAVERGFAAETAKLVDSGAGKTVNTELLISYQPDFVILSADIAGQKDTAVTLRQAGIPTASLRMESFEDYLNVLKICTDINATPEIYQQHGVALREKIDGILQKVPNKNNSILFIRSGSSASSAKAKKAEDHFAAKMLEELGAYNIADTATVLLDGLSTEEIISADPDYIFIVTMGSEKAAKAYMDSVLADKTWQSLSAVQSGRCYYLPKDLFQFKPNANWDEAYLYLARLLYPDVEF